MLVLQWLFVFYFVAANGAYLVLNALSYVSLRRQVAAQAFGDLPQAYSHFKPPISVLVYARDQAGRIAASVRAVLQLDYHEFEVIVIDDGSTDGTLAELQREFELAPFAEAYWNKLPTHPVRGIWRSALQPNLRVIDKESGGRADALNAGINAARYPLFCNMDADVILQRDSLQLIVQPFIEDARTIAAGGAVRIANGCKLSEGLLSGVGLPPRLLSRLQIVECLGAFLYARFGWSPLNAILAFSGAFGLFRKASVIEVGGYRSGGVGDETELLMRLHRIHRERDICYRIAFVPNPVCWTRVPEELGAQAAQRIRWQSSLSESVMANMGLMFSLRGGWAGWLAFPFTLIFEWLGPLFEVSAYVFMTGGVLSGVVSVKIFAAFMLLALVLGILLSISALLMEEMSFHPYPRLRQLAFLLLMAIVENFGYRQLVQVWRLKGLFQWLIGPRVHRRAMRWLRRQPQGH